MAMEKRTVTPAELGEVMRKRKAKPGNRPVVRIRGEAVIRDKDGNIKGKMILRGIDEEN